VTSYPLATTLGKKKNKSISKCIGETKIKVSKHIAPIVKESNVRKALARDRCRDRIYHAWPLFQLWLHQGITGGSCRETIAWGISVGLIPPWASPRTPAYCNARVRLDEEPLLEIMVSTGRAVENSCDRRRRPFGRDVVVVDGSSVQLPDTPSNQAAYPQPKGQKPGCGQPVMHLVTLMGLGGGAILDVACAAGSGHERALFRKLWPSLKPRDIVLADNGFCSYAEVASLLGIGADVLMAQKEKFLCNKEVIEIGRDDYVVLWRCGDWTRKWIDNDRLPECLVVRAVAFRQRRSDGSSVRRILLTTLLDPHRYTRKKLIALYRRRWEIEMTLDDIKTEMGLELLGCRSPKRCRCELFVGLTAYNIVRGVMLDAAREAGLAPREISFAGTLGRMIAFSNSRVFDGDSVKVYRLLLIHCARDRLQKRPGRREPRKCKRRSKNYRLLTSPRNPFNHAPSIP
jgi:hypothetical protein